MTLQEHITPLGESILYTGSPDLAMLDELSTGPGDIWHSGPDQGLRDAFSEMQYQTTVFFWYNRDFAGLDRSPSWRLNPDAFAVRRHVWDQLQGFDPVFTNRYMAALDFAVNALRNGGAVVLYVANLFTKEYVSGLRISAFDRHLFFARNFKKRQALFMVYRKGFWKINEWKAYFRARRTPMRTSYPCLVPRTLLPVEGKPTVSYIIPTLGRQKYARQLIDDLSRQNYLPMEVIVVDATPPEQRTKGIYAGTFPFELIVVWAEIKGSCRQRNTAIELSRGAFIGFGDDDIRIPPEFIENHIRFLQTYRIEAANGLDVRAPHHSAGLDVLASKLSRMNPAQKRAGIAQHLSNSNAFASRDAVMRVGGNDLNYEGGYGEDNDFGFSMLKSGTLLLHNPHSPILHLKPPAGGYRIWGSQAKKMGRARKVQPWEHDTPVKWVRPLPSPTLMYYYHKHFGRRELVEYRHKYFFLYLFQNGLKSFVPRLLGLPYRLLQFKRSVFYARKLMDLGTRLK